MSERAPPLRTLLGGAALMALAAGCAGVSEPAAPAPAPAALAEPVAAPAELEAQAVARPAPRRTGPRYNRTGGEIPEAAPTERTESRGLGEVG